MATQDPKEQVRLMKELNLYFMAKTYIIDMPGKYEYWFWQPWLKGYHGEEGMAITMGQLGFAWLTWVDQDLKQAMTGKR